MSTRHPHLARLLLIAPLLLASSAARADVPRDPGFVPTCTPEKAQEAGGGPCEQCRGYKSEDPCQEALAKKGYTKRCTEGGAGSYVAVWCKGGPSAPATPAGPAQPAPVKPTSSRCALGEGPAEGGGWVLAMGAVGLLLAGMRRRR